MELSRGIFIKARVQWQMQKLIMHGVMRALRYNKNFSIHESVTRFAGKDGRKDG